MTDINKDLCPICYDDMGDEKNLICGHLVHISCIKKSFRAECPLCRTKLDIEVEGKYIHERRYENEDTEEHSEEEDQDDEEEHESEDEEEKRPYWSYIEDDEKDDSERESDSEKEGGFYSEDDEEEEQDSDEDDKMPLPECINCRSGYPHMICLRRVLLHNYTKE